MEPFVAKALAVDWRLGPTSSSLTTSKNFVEVLTDRNGIADRILEVITIIAGMLAIFYLIWNGIQYIISAGNPERIKLARSGVVNAIIGIVVIVAAYSIIRLAFSLGNSVGESVR